MCLHINDSNAYCRRKVMVAVILLRLRMDAFSDEDLEFSPISWWGASRKQVVVAQLIAGVMKDICREEGSCDYQVWKNAVKARVFKSWRCQ